VSSIADRVKKIVGDQLTIPEDQVTPQKSFEADLGADSIGLVELMMQFEDEFDMSIPDEEAEKIKTVGDAIKYIEEHMN
jgi:acyl carrier protein